MKPRFGDTYYDPHAEEMSAAAQSAALAIGEFGNALQAEFTQAFNSAILAFAQLRVEIEKAFEGIDLDSFNLNSTEEPH